MRTPKRPSYTCLVFTALKEADDFMVLRQIAAKSGVSTTRASAALHHLYKKKAVSALSDDGQLYWYATPDEDSRHYSNDVVNDKETHRTRTRKSKPHPRRKSGELPSRK